MSQFHSNQSSFGECGSYSGLMVCIDDNKNITLNGQIQSKVNTTHNSPTCNWNSVDIFTSQNVDPSSVCSSQSDIINSMSFVMGFKQLTKSMDQKVDSYRLTQSLICPLPDISKTLNLLNSANQNQLNPEQRDLLKEMNKAC